MTILVTAASKHGATTEIAEAIVRTLVEEGLDAEFKRPEDVASVDGYDACVIGSGVYVGHWLDEATSLVARNARELRDRPVWIFSSGPLGESPKPDAEHSVDVGKVVELLEPRGHELFGGKLDPRVLGFGERAVVKAVRAPVGDFRDWPAMERWAREVARGV